ncbi:MAG TPA: Ger(x)C family spore germination protein [Ureibacillus sp.]|nr:Ger(x)C family spore germination protein [Ureibacillus sp.]
MLKRQSKTKIFFLSLIPFLMLLSGCEFKDIDKDVFVSMIAIDKSSDNDKPYKITLKFYQPTSSYKEAPEPQFSYLTQNGESLSEAIRLMESYIDKEIEFGHSKLIVIGEDLIKAKKSKEILDFLLRRPDIQMISWITVGRPTAEEIVHLVPEGENAAYPAIFNYFDENGTESQYIVTSYLFDFRRRLKEEGIDTVLPIIVIDEEKKHFKVNRALILRNNKEPHELSTLDTGIYNMLTSRAKVADLIIKEEGDYFIARIDSIDSKFKVNVSDTKKITIELEVSLVGYISESKETLQNKDLPYLNKLLEKDANMKFTAFMEEMIKNGYDPLGFRMNYKSHTLHNHRISTEEWNEAYKDAEIHITVKPGLKSTGTIQ